VIFLFSYGFYFGIIVAPKSGAAINHDYFIAGLLKPGFFQIVCMSGIFINKFHNII